MSRPLKKRFGPLCLRLVGYCLWRCWRGDAGPWLLRAINSWSFRVGCALQDGPGLLGCDQHCARPHRGCPGSPIAARHSAGLMRRTLPPEQCSRFIRTAVRPRCSCVRHRVRPVVWAALSWPCSPAMPPHGVTVLDPRQQRAWGCRRERFRPERATKRRYCSAQSEPGLVLCVHLLCTVKTRSGSWCAPRVHRQNQVCFLVCTAGMKSFET